MVSTPTMPRVAPARRRRGRVLLTMLAVVVIWVAAGFLRAPGIAQAYIAQTERPKQVSQVSTTVGPALPPFWSVQVQAKVTEATGTSYTSARILWVEPITGFVLTMGAG